jgi:thioredoxin 1
MRKVQQVTTAEFENTVLRSDIPVLVDFFASWCMPCKLLAPVLEALSEEFEGRVKVLTVDVEAEAALAERYGIHAVPTLKIFEGSQVRESMEGLVPPESLRAKLESLGATSATASGV